MSSRLSIWYSIQLQNYEYCANRKLFIWFAILYFVSPNGRCNELEHYGHSIMEWAASGWFVCCSLTLFLSSSKLYMLSPPNWCAFVFTFPIISAHRLWMVSSVRCVFLHIFLSISTPWNSFKDWKEINDVGVNSITKFVQSAKIKIESLQPKKWKHARDNRKIQSWPEKKCRAQTKEKMRLLKHWKRSNCLDWNSMVFLKRNSFRIKKKSKVIPMQIVPSFRCKYLYWFVRFLQKIPNPFATHYGSTLNV